MEKRVMESRFNKSRSSRFRFDILHYILPKQKRSQQILGLSFGMIFSIFLIIFFIMIAFIVIKQFLGVQDCTKWEFLLMV